MTWQEHTGNLLDYSYHQNYYKHIGIDLSRQITTSLHQQINFTTKLEEENGETMFFIVGEQQNTILNFSLGSVTATE